MKAKAIIIEKQGGPSVMQLKEVALGDPGPREVLVRQSAIGLNYLDIYHRSGHYPLPMPSGLGSEAAGVIEVVGAHVEGFRPGERVAYAGGAPGAYCDLRVMGTEKLVKLADALNADLAAAVLLKGMTVEYLLNRTYSVKPGQTILFYAAAGGVGLIAGQWAKALGARAIGVAGGADKCQFARAHGYDVVLDRNSENIVERVRELTDNRGVEVVYDSVGQATFEQSIECLAPRGMFVSFGNTTGDAPPVPPSLLQKKGSLYFTRPTLVTYTAAREDLEASAATVFDMVTSGKIKIEINQTYPLGDVAQAHINLESGKTMGSTVLQPDHG